LAEFPRESVPEQHPLCTLSRSNANDIIITSQNVKCHRMAKKFFLVSSA